MTRETLELLSELLGHVQLNVGSPDFAEQASRFAAAKAELDAALAEAD